MEVGPYFTTSTGPTLTLMGPSRGLTAPAGRDTMPLVHDAV